MSKDSRITSNADGHFEPAVERIPFIDATVRHVGVSSLRLSASELAALGQTVVIHDWKEDGKPLAVLMPYEAYLSMQAARGKR